MITLTPMGNLQALLTYCSLHVFALLEYTGVPGGNPCRNREKEVKKLSTERFVAPRQVELCPHESECATQTCLH